VFIVGSSWATFHGGVLVAKGLRRHRIEEHFSGSPLDPQTPNSKQSPKMLNRHRERTPASVSCKKTNQNIVLNIA